MSSQNETLPALQVVIRYPSTQCQLSGAISRCRAVLSAACEQSLRLATTALVEIDILAQQAGGQKLQ